jgi:flavin reductase (DIM6/NTAB) family NADH-FMN oxidoreductase RutF
MNSKRFHGMSRQPIAVYDFNLNIFQAWDRGWYLLTAGDFTSGRYNTMTVSWGSMGIMWNKPFIQVVVRPQRYTFEFIEQFPTFTLSAFDKQYRKALNLLGDKTGRDCDKIAESGLVPEAASTVAAPGFQQADLVIECEKMYYDNLEPGHFLSEQIAPHYHGDFHRVYYGEIKAISGIEKYRR